MDVDWIEYLAGKGYHGRRATGAEVAYPCFFDCDEQADSRKRKLYVNAETGLYSCKVCVSEGNGVLLMRHFGDDPKQSDDGPRLGRRSEVLEYATRCAEEQLGNNEDVIDYLLGPRRSLSPETIVARRLGYGSKAWPLSQQLPEEAKFSRDDVRAAGLFGIRRNDRGEETGTYEFFRDLVVIPYIENGRVVQLRGKDIFGRYYTPDGDPVFLYNVDSLKGATEAVIVEGEFDTMILADLLAGSGNERLQKIAVVGIAGTGAIPEGFESRFAHLKRVFIATDPDEPGRRAADKLKDRLGDRAFIPMWPIEVTGAWVRDGRELKDLDWTTWIGKLGASADTVGEMLKAPGRLKSALQALVGHRNRPTTGIQLGFAGLDAAFLPGLLPGQVFVMLAKTGVGKTLLLCNLAYNLRKRRVLFITLEMTAEEIWVRLARIYRFYDPFTSDESIAAAYANLRICDSNRLSEEDFQRLVDEYTDDIGAPPEIAFVDYLGYYARGRQGGSQYEKTTDAIMQLKSEAKRYGIAVVTPAQVNRGAEDGKPIDTDDARDSGAIEETADLLVGVWRADDALELTGTPNGKLHMKILKSRHGNRDKTFLMQMGLHSLVIVDDTSVHAPKAHRESQSIFRGETYEQFLASVRNRDHHLKG